MTARIESRVPRTDYDKVEGVSITKLKELRRSPQHYRHALTHPKKSGALTLGIAAHIAVLEPDRFASEFAIWDRRTASDSMAPRKGQYWEAFCMENSDRTVLTPDAGKLCAAIAKAVRANPVAMPYLETGEPEVTLLWECQGRQCKGRVDWLTQLNRPYIVGLKTARDCRPFQFGSQCAKLGYHLQFAFYHDGDEAITGERPAMVEIVVEPTPPHAVAVYRITEDVLAQGRDEYLRLLDKLTECEVTGDWPGPVPQEEDLTLPTWAYDAADDDISELGLEVTP